MKTQENEDKLNLTFESIPMKKVLIAIDYNPNAQKLAELGFSMAKNMNAEVKLLHVVVEDSNYTPLDFNPVTGFGEFGPIYYHGDINLAELKKAAACFLDKVKEHLGDTAIETFVEEGSDTAETILKTAENLGVDVIVVGSHSRRWLEQIVMGQVTEKILRRTSLPVFIVPTGVQKK
jgi:nucleotide-binding universal stress UspA family protein